MSDVVAVLTPPGRSALATLAVHGPRTREIVRELFRTRTGKPLPDVPAPPQFWLGTFGDQVSDEVVLAVKDATMELHCHGGREVVRYLLELLTSRGLSEILWSEFLRCTTGDEIRADALAGLAHAPTVRTAAILLDQANGALERALAEIETAEHAQALLRWAPLGRHLTDPWRVVVAGAPNVGKSSLMNALSGYQRSIVADTPGTTRDVVTVRLALDGWPVELADTAGLRASEDDLESAGVQRAAALLERADLVLWVVDATCLPPPSLEGKGAGGTDPTDATRRIIKLIVNKIDQPPAWDIAAAHPDACVSALTGQGIPELVESIARWLVPEVPPSGTAVPFTERLIDSLGARSGMTKKT
jgi:tRNA modification GTPase